MLYDPVQYTNVNMFFCSSVSSLLHFYLGELALKEYQDECV